MIGGQSGDIGYDFEPVITLYELLRMIKKGKIPIEVKFNPPLLGDPDGVVYYKENEVHYLQAKSRIPSGKNWTTKNSDVIRAISNFSLIDIEARSQTMIGININLRYFLCLEGDPNKDLRDFSQAIKNLLEPKNMKLVRKWVSSWLASPHWKDSKNENGDLLPRPSDEEVIAALMKTRICYRFDKPQLETNMSEMLGSHYSVFLLAAKKKIVKGSVLDNIISFIREKDEIIEKALKRIMDSNIPKTVREILKNLLIGNIIIDFTNNPWNLNGRNLELCGTIHTKTKLLGIHYTEEVVLGDDISSYAMDAVVPGTREIILVTSSTITHKHRGIHIVNPDSNTLDSDLLRCVVNEFEQS